MKKFLFGLLSITLFVFTACNNLINNNSDDFSFGLDQSVARSIQNNVLSSGVISSSDQVTLSCSITNYGNRRESTSVSLDNLDKAILSFKSIPYGRKLNLLVSVSYKGIPLYEGTQNNVVLSYNKNTISISLKPSKYDITYNTNEGSLPSSNILSSYYFSTGVKSLPQPTKEGYYFEGWFEDPLFTGSPISTISSSDFGNKTYYAKWSLVTNLIKHNITYVSEGKVIKTLEVPYGRVLSNTELAPLPDTSTDAFIGWYIGNQKIENGILQVTKDITLTAKWNTIKYTITYEDPFGPTKKVTVPINTILSKEHLKDLSKDGFIFEGWFLDNNKVEYDSITVTYDLTLTAKWKEIPNEVKHYVTYKSSRGTLFDDVVPIVEGTKLTKEYLPTLEDVSGYKFIGWSDGENPIEADTVTVTKDITLIAQWSPISYTITYNFNDNVTKTKKVTYTIETIPSELEKPLREGWGFDGWFDENINQVTSITKETIGDKNLTAHWTQNSYSIIYQSQYDTVPKTKKVSGGTSLTTSDLPTLSEKGYSFDGWYVAGTKINEGYKVNNDIELVAMWSKITYTITYDLNYSGSQSQNATYTVDNIPYELLSPSRTNWGFDGWYTSKECTGNPITNITIDTIGDKTFYAKWSQNKSYITYKSSHGQPPIKKAIGTGSQLTSNELPTLNQDGYTFDGWYKDGVKVKEGESVNTDITLTAQWTPISYSITYDLGKGKWAGVEHPTQYNIETPDFEIPLPKCVGYKFRGWKEEPTGKPSTSTIIKKGTIGNKKFYADWAMINYKLTYFNCDGATNDNPKTFNVETPTFTLKDPIMNGKHFVGWYTDNTYQHPAETTIVKGSVHGREFYAQWNDVFTVSYYSEFGKAPSSFEFTSPLTLDSSHLPKLSEEGYTFNGWYIGNEEITTGKEITKDTMLTAKWTKNSYEITYVSEQGGAPGITSLEHGTILTTEHLPNATKNGYNFLGWYIDNKKVDASSNYKVVGPITIEGKWDLIYYPINYVYVEDGKNENRQSYTVLSETFTLSKPTRNGYKFIDWYSDKDLTKPANKTITKGSTGERTFYAKWVSSETKTFLWNQNRGVYLTDDVQNPGSSLFNNKSIDVKDFCFDNSGEVHIVGTNGYFVSNPKKSITNTTNMVLVRCDSVTDKIYTADNTLSNLYVMENDIETKLSLPQNTKIDFNNFAVNNNIVYLLKSYSVGSITVSKYTISNNKLSKNGTDVSIKTGITRADSILITDAYIKDNELYILIQDSNGGKFRKDSRGLIIEAKLDNLSNSRTFGWTNTVTDGVNNAISSYSPTSMESKNNFFGPRKIVADKGNKIMIADEGLFFSYIIDNTNTSNTGYYYYNTDRVVTFNLSSFNIEKVDLLKNMKFDYHETSTPNYNSVQWKPKN